MKLLALFGSLFGSKKRATRKTIAEYKQDMLVESGRQQFQYLLQKKLRVPVVLL